MNQENIDPALELNEKRIGIVIAAALVAFAIAIGYFSGIFQQGINGTTFYYMIMLAIVAASKAFKTHQLGKVDTSVTWRHYGQVALDFANAAAGIVTLMISKDQESGTIIVAAYLFLYVVSTNFDARAKEYKPNTIFYANILVTIVFISGIVYFCQTLLSPKKAPAPTTVSYQVAVPYTDTSLRQWYSGPLGSRSLTYFTEVEAINHEEARKKARTKFWEDPAVQPLHPKVQKDRSTLILDVDRIVVEAAIVTRPAPPK